LTVGVSRPRASRLTPLWRLPVLEPLQGFFWRADFTLVARRVIRDCLESS
jgi:acetoacetate decarboxylase